MNAKSIKVQAVIESVFTKVLDRLQKDNGIALISDLHVQIDRESGELSLYDDRGSLLEKIVIFDWINSKQPEELFIKHASSLIKAALSSLVSKDAFNIPCLLKPFSVNLVDEEFTDQEELLFLDDELLRIDDPLLKDIDAELDDFLAKLLSDVE